ncbi:RlmE family RNA methyltransferase [Buchnera aphidicola]|uniref:RlmE family RNA methyltransferase n=1 Tax=Buchnera aphidicola TaxID=9 RepID=UPI0034646C15
MIYKKVSKSSHRWLLEHFNDKYVKEAQKNRLRSRSWFKLEEIDKKNKLFRSGMHVLDLGSSPGGWSQYAVSKIGKKGHVIAFDILPMKKIIGVDFFQIDFFNKKKLQLMLNNFSNSNFNVIMSDMAPNMTGCSFIDMPRIIEICNIALKISNCLLSRNGILLLKSFQGEGFNDFFSQMKLFFSKIKIFKPKTSRARSREIFILATR